MTAARDDDPAIEALRGLAALAVVAAHYARFVTLEPGVWGFASTGVDLFFVLSGYVFGAYFFGKALAPGPHLVRRFFRLYPLYVLALITYAALKMPDPHAWREFGSHLFMLHTLQSPQVAFFYNPAFWSLPPEVEFYLLLPLLAVLGRQGQFGRLFAAALALHLLLAAFAVAGEGSTPRAVATVHLPGLLVEFCLGAWAYQAVRAQPSPRAAAWRLAAGAAWLVVVVWLYAVFIADGRGASAPAWIGGNIGLGAAAGYALVVSALATRAQRLRGLALRTCLVAGELSYAVYLFHNAAAQAVERATGASGWAALGMSLAFTLLVAFVLHHAVEAPAREFGRQWSRRLGERQRA